MIILILPIWHSIQIRQYYNKTFSLPKLKIIDTRSKHFVVSWLKSTFLALMKELKKLNTSEKKNKHNRLNYWMHQGRSELLDFCLRCYRYFIFLKISIILLFASIFISICTSSYMENFRCISVWKQSQNNCIKNLFMCDKKNIFAKEYIMFFIWHVEQAHHIIWLLTL